MSGSTIIVLDCSESMSEWVKGTEYSFFNLACDIVEKILLPALPTNEPIGLIALAGTMASHSCHARLLVPPHLGSSDAILHLIDSQQLCPSGTKPLWQGIRNALDLLQDNGGRIFILTDKKNDSCWCIDRKTLLSRANSSIKLYSIGIGCGYEHMIELISFHAIGGCFGTHDKEPGSLDEILENLRADLLGAGALDDSQQKQQEELQPVSVSDNLQEERQKEPEATVAFSSPQNQWRGTRLFVGISLVVVLIVFPLGWIGHKLIKKLNSHHD